MAQAENDVLVCPPLVTTVILKKEALQTGSSCRFGWWVGRAQVCNDIWLSLIHISEPTRPY